MTPAPCTTHAWQSTDTEALQHPCLFLQSATRRILLPGFACQDPLIQPTRPHLALTLALVAQRLLTIGIATAASARLASHAQGTKTLRSPEHSVSTPSGPGVTHDPYSSVLLALIAIIALFSRRRRRHAAHRCLPGIVTSMTRHVLPCFIAPCELLHEGLTTVAKRRRNYADLPLTSRSL
jgi:MYXO-CTERM domain-containing protein